LEIAIIKPDIGQKDSLECSANSSNTLDSSFISTSIIIGESQVRPSSVPSLLEKARSNTGWKSLNVGGNWSNGSNAGVAYANANNDISNSNSNIGARLAISSETVPSHITLGTNLASRQKKTTNDSRSVGRWGECSASEDRIEVDKQGAPS